MYGASLANSRSNIMKKIFIALLAALLISPAYADGGHGRHHGGEFRGGWGWEGGWIFPALIGGAIIYDITQPRTTYVQPEPIYLPSVAPVAAASWYFCPAANGYYPYVASCPSGWQTVPATPPVPPAVPNTANTTPAQ
jgi:hypothetical protein